MYVRVEVATRSEFIDPQAGFYLNKIKLALPSVFPKVRWLRYLDVYWINVEEQREKVITAIEETFKDSVINWLFTGDLIPSAAGRSGTVLDLFENSPHPTGKFWGIERRFRPGVTDNTAKTAQEAFEIILGHQDQKSFFSTGGLLLVEGERLTEEDIALISKNVFCNELIQSWTMYLEHELKLNTRFQAEEVKRELPVVKMKPSSEVKTYDLNGLTDEELEALSKKQIWALSLEEMKAIRDHFRGRNQNGLTKPTDVEIEVIAQTWSEHCKHKLFNAKIDYESDEINGPSIPSQINSLFKETVADVTKQLPRSWLLSVFSDNAGIFALDEEDAFCIKVETHNSPSALDPYGGSLTGIVGVNRDILGCGRGARPVFNTNVFCLALPDTNQGLPDGLLHPRRILDGVRMGVEHGGNKSGIPTINGALVFDQRYLGKPLIYCGTGGILPRKVCGEDSSRKEIRLGDRVCMVGGRIGKDGIHGATFSSLALDETAPATAVQLGDPITQKRMTDFLLEARDRCLYRTITDNGAGGLSSSVGELATLSNGVKLDVSLAKTKYPGLKPFELVISESQERMTVVVPPEKLNEFIELAERRSVEVSDLGEFTQSGLFEIFYADKQVACLNLDFLHHGVPQIHLKAKWFESKRSVSVVRKSFSNEGFKQLCDLLAQPNVASKEWLIRQYDHEVQAGSVIKPLQTVGIGTSQENSGPNDSGVIKPKDNSWVGVAVGCGINPKYSDLDPYVMAQMVVDESLRNILCSGSEYGNENAVVTLVDNFCWPDPVQNEVTAGALVRTCFGMREAALALEIPLVSGKDSMKNDYVGKKDGKPVKISVPPTLLMTAVGRVPDVRYSRSSDFKSAGDQIYLLGSGDLSLLGSELHSVCKSNLEQKGGSERQVVLPSYLQQDQINIPKPNWKEAKKIYSWLGGSIGEKQKSLRSAHDVSDGGLLVAIAESLIPRSLGADVIFPEGVSEDPWSFGFGEGFHSIVVSVAQVEAVLLEDEWRSLGVPYLHLGKVTHSGRLKVKWSEQGADQEFSGSVKELQNAWVKKGYWQ